MKTDRERIVLAQPNQCTGCGACRDICPVQAIRMEPDERSYVQPVIQTSSCVVCHRCEQVCPVLQMPPKNWEQPTCYAAWAPEEIRMGSSSGGVFPLLADWTLQQGGVVWGAVMKDLYSVQHCMAEDQQGVDAMRHSKYLQSDLNGVYRKVAELLQSGRQVLFTGTPCQVAALRNFLGKEPKNLLLMDVVCNGVPSQKMWEAYVRENDFAENVQSLAFRDKEAGWISSLISVKRKDGSKKLLGCEDSAYAQGFYRGLLQRTACFQCPFSDFPRQGDLTIGDFWGIERYDASWNDHKGTSIILLNTEKGQKAFEAIRPNLARCEKADVRYSDYNRLHASIPMHPQRERFFSLWEKGSFSYAADMAANQKYDVAVLGCWSVENHGSNMTYYALYKTLTEMGYETLMVERPQSAQWKPHERPDGFLKNPYRECDLAPLFADKRAMKALNDRCSRFVLGSDQLLYHDLYRSFDEFIDMRYIHANKIKVAYATSLGRDRFEGTETQRSTLALWLQKFDAVGVREECGVEVLQREFGTKAVWTPDPVFLRPQKEYEEMARLAPFDAKEPFIGVYVLDPSPQKEDALQYAAQKLRMPLRVFSDVAHSAAAVQSAWSLPTDVTASNEAWLRSILECSFFITDSFHGTCFAILFNKPFICIGNRYRGITRFTSLLKHLELSHRMVEELSLLPQQPELFEAVDYIPVNAKIEQDAAAAKRWLQEALERKSCKKLSEYDLLDDRMDGIQDAAEEGKKRSLTNESWLANTHARVDQLEVGSLEQQEILAGERQRLSETQNWLASTHTRVDRLEAGSLEQQDTLAKLTTLLQQAEEDLETAKTQIDALQNTFYWRFRRFLARLFRRTM